MTDLQAILNFWFTPPMNQHWFSSTEEIDTEIRNRFEGLWKRAMAAELEEWRNSPAGCVALAVILDQFPLNMFRGKPDSFASEEQAVTVSRHAIEMGFDLRVAAPMRLFLYMPLMHSESLDDQDLSVTKFAESEAELGDSLRFARHHRGLIERFGRFPHRNVILGRESSQEEQTYLASKEAFLG